ncbi:MAG: SRPBCC domain-containing protein [Cyclobacteriaceae bacterium]
MPDLKKYFIIPAPPEEVYLALTTEATIRLWTGDQVEMTTEPGSEFSLWDGSITGKNLEFEPGKRLVQEWYFGENEEPSIVTIKLHPHKQGTSAELRHTNIPEGDFDDMADGWEHSYFGSLIEFYEEE